MQIAQKSFLSSLLFLAISSSLLSTSSQAQSNDVSDFKHAYARYQDVIQTRNYDEHRKYAKKSYQLGCKLYGEYSVDCASLTVNYANTLWKEDEKVQSLYDSAFVIYKNKYGENSAEVADLYIQLAGELSQEKYQSPLQNALDIAEQVEDISPLLTAEIQLQAGIIYLKRHATKARILVNAYETFSNALPENEVRVVKSRLLLAKYYRAKGLYSKSIALNEQNISVFEQLDGVTHPLELTTRADLVNAYEIKKQHEKSTEHCMAIGSMQPWDDDQEQTPLFRVAPTYPVSAVKRHKEGYVKLNFTIDEFGQVKETKVISSTDKVFEKPSLTALNQWRYAPKFEQGKPVPVSDLVVQLDFKMSPK